jgi:hypothetical protein
MEYLTGGLRYGPVVRAAVYGTTSFILFVLLGRRGRRELDKVRFVVSREGMVRSTPYRKTAVRWPDIVSVRCRRVPFLKGFVEVAASHTKLYLPSTIAGFALLGTALRRGLESAGKTALCNDAFYAEMAAMGDVGERWNARAKAAFWPLTLSTIGAALFNAFVALWVWKLGPIPLVLWTAICLPAPLIVYSIADLRLNRQLKKSLMREEGTAYREDLWGELIIGFLVVMPFYGIFGIFFKTIFHP